MEQEGRFKGLKLKAADRRELKRMQSKGEHTARVWRRVQVLLMLDRAMSIAGTATALGMYRREVSRVAWRYLERGLEAALGEEPRPGITPKLDSAQRAAVVALVCGPAPSGRARWTVRLLAEEAVRRGIAPDISRETMRRVLATHDLKPWREKNVVRDEDRRRIRRPNGRRASALRAQMQV